MGKMEGNKPSILTIYDLPVENKKEDLITITDLQFFYIKFP